MQGQRVLVTGGAGFIGSNLANRLAEQNDVVAVDGYLGTPENLADAVEFHDQSVLAEDLPTDVDVLFHLAALPPSATREASPAKSARVNVEGFVNTVEQARDDGCDTVVYASTSSVYGSQTEPSPERMSVSARTADEASKLARERYAEYFANHYDLAMAGVRLFSVYGDGPAEERDGEASVVAQFAADAANGCSPEIYGDGSQTRDFVHVEDAVRGLELAAENRLTGVYNLGTGRSHDFDTVVEYVNQELGTDVEPEYVANPVPEGAYVDDAKADVSTFERETGWKPTVTFREGVRRVCERCR